MKAKNESYVGALTQKGFYQDGSTTADTLLGISAGGELVEPGPLRLGDHHTPTPWSYNIGQYTNYFGKIKSIHNYGDGGFPHFESEGSFSFGVSDPVEIWLREQAYNACLDKINAKMRSTLDLSVDIGQRRQALQMIATRLNPKSIIAIGNQLLKLKSFRRKVARNKARGVKYSDDNQLSWRDGFTIPADLWLEFTYGWRPLVSSIWEAVDLLTLDVERNLSVQARVKLPMPSQKSCVSPVMGIPCTARGKGFSSCTINVKLKTQLDEADKARFTSLNPASIYWELMPYSFVVDWFIDVGSYLRNMETALLYRNAVESTVVSELYVHNYVYEVSGHTKDSNDVYTEADLASTQIFKRFERTVGSQSLFPRTPKFRANLGSSRLFSAASLLAQFLKK